MDPNATLKELETNLTNAAFANIKLVNFWLCEDLKNWLDKKGFEPDWDKYPAATAYYRKFQEQL